MKKRTKTREPQKSTNTGSPNFQYAIRRLVINGNTTEKIINTVYLGQGKIVLYVWPRPTKSDESPALLQHLEDVARTAALAALQNATQPPVEGPLRTNWEGETLEGWFAL